MQSRSATRLASKPAGSATLSGGMGGEKDPEQTTPNISCFIARAFRELRCREATGRAKYSRKRSADSHFTGRELASANRPFPAQKQLSSVDKYPEGIAGMVRPMTSLATRSQFDWGMLLKKS